MLIMTEIETAPVEAPLHRRAVRRSALRWLLPARVHVHGSACAYDLSTAQVTVSRKQFCYPFTRMSRAGDRVQSANCWFELGVWILHLRALPLQLPCVRCHHVRPHSNWSRYIGCCW
mmetsp:Transcript_57140/g.152152  ORF Transcript_57140/g.152152 Transcript_57140/m.152152 type:complete len:117 (+) Transcript_57140:531-881(+)